MLDFGKESVDSYTDTYNDLFQIWFYNLKSIRKNIYLEPFFMQSRNFHSSLSGHIIEVEKSSSNVLLHYCGENESKDPSLQSYILNDLRQDYIQGWWFDRESDSG